MSSSINDSAFAFIGGVEEANIVRLKVRIITTGGTVKAYRAR